ncbi:hypothetical protein BOTBODRAFT_168739 [Botryobasidium botryosum FD-172 SS1]|uniref:Uncharacterized protein n=1 Tax=Botryobasidium botryosum (strain FD-172 SS1) TaxID=930990 RepID=A0A067N3D6_BOTB1|nr:hypothetical protein BOTBODRAFT_168739 [Botryobasidium botryosum FD-172 SS1]
MSFTKTDGTPFNYYTWEELAGFPLGSCKSLRNNPLPHPLRVKEFHPFLDSKVLLGPPTMEYLERNILNEGMPNEMIVARRAWLTGLEVHTERLALHWERHMVWLKAFDKFHESINRRLSGGSEYDSEAVMGLMVDEVRARAAVTMGLEHGLDDELIGSVGDEVAQSKLTLSLADCFSRGPPPESPMSHSTAHVDPSRLAQILRTKKHALGHIDPCFSTKMSTEADMTRSYFAFILDACSKLSYSGSLVDSPRSMTLPISPTVFVPAFGLSVVFSLILFMYFPLLLG